MTKPVKHQFKAEIYKTVINFCVDVPAEITTSLNKVKGYIRVKGTVNGIPFTKFLVPVKNGPYRLFINTVTMKDIKDRAGEIAGFVIEQDEENLEKDYPMPELLKNQLKEKGIAEPFESLSYSRRKDILRYLNNVKTAGTLEKSIQKVIAQLQRMPVEGSLPISLKIS